MMHSEGAHAHPRRQVHAPAGPAAHAPLATYLVIQAWGSSASLSMLFGR